jgi:hypothetical protein
MKLRNIATLIAGMAASLGLISITGQQANAGTLYQNWNYSIDAFNDGSGGSAYDIKGIAVKETADSIFVALTGGMPLTGTYASAAVDKNIGWGDLFFNFTGNNFQTASDAKSLFGIRFAGTNDSNASSTGIYKNVQATSVTGINNGYSSLQQYNDAGWYKTNTLGTDLPTKADAYGYLGQGSVLNVIGSGTKVGDITMLTTGALTAAGLDFAHFAASGTETIGFQFSKSLFGSGDYLAHVFVECANDGVALAGELKDVPEPTGLGGLAVVGLVVGGSQLRKRRRVRVSVN